MLVSGIVDLSDNETLSLVLKLVAVLFLCGALGAGFALNKKLQQSQHGQPFSQQQMPPFPPQRPQQGPPTRGQ